MIWRLIKFETKNLIRDRMTGMLLAMPVLIGWLGKTLLDNNTLGLEYANNMLIIGLTMITGVFFGSMAGFSILDDRDDHVFVSIQISPMDIKAYVWFKVIYVYLLSVVGTLVIFAMVGGMGLTWIEILAIALLGSLQAPTNAFLVNAFASNKVEGFVAMKASGFLMIFPIISTLFLDWKAWLFAIAPAFWGAKAVQRVLLDGAIEAGIVAMPLSFWGYVGLGFVYNLALTGFMYTVFKRKYLN
jgi:fluoroquinolone transport system permease protein